VAHVVFAALGMGDVGGIHGDGWRVKSNDDYTPGLMAP
jgi:hypothetical protein